MGIGRGVTRANLGDGYPDVINCGPSYIWRTDVRPIRPAGGAPPGRPQHASHRSPRHPPRNRWHHAAPRNHCEARLGWRHGATCVVWSRLQHARDAHRAVARRRGRVLEPCPRYRWASTYRALKVPERPHHTLLLLVGNTMPALRSHPLWLALGLSLSITGCHKRYQSRRRPGPCQSRRRKAGSATVETSDASGGTPKPRRGRRRDRQRGRHRGLGQAQKSSTTTSPDTTRDAMATGLLQSVDQALPYKVGKAARD